MIDIKTEFEKSDFNYDRKLNVNDVLPFSDEFLIQPNELSFYKTINKKLSYLYDNFLYIYSRCSVPNYQIPTSYSGFIGVVDSDIGIYQDFTVSEPFSDGGFPNLDSAKNSIVYKKDESYYFFINCLSAINVLRYNGETNFCQTCPNILTTVDPISGELKFSKISDIDILENKYLCVSDEGLDVVYKYDLDSYFSSENIFKSNKAPFGNNLFLLESVGGNGSRYNPIKFNTPKNMSVYDDLILVEDQGNKIFKLFDSDFSFLSYRTFITLYNTVTSFQNVIFKDKETIYGIVENGYYVFNVNLENYRIDLSHFQSLSGILKEDEKVLDFKFSKYEKDISYVLTDKSFIKKWEYINDEIIGRKNVSDFGENSEFKWMSTCSKTTSSDNIYLYLYNSTANANQILIYEDELDLISNFGQENFKVYSRNEILIKKNEWNQCWVYEKSLKKMSKNLDILKNNIYYNIIREQDDFGSVYDIRKIYNKFTFDEIPINYNIKFSIGVNENFQSSVVNREIGNIFKYEQNLLDFVLIDNDIVYEDEIDIEYQKPLVTIVDGIGIVEIKGSINDQIYTIKGKGIINLENKQMYSFNNEELYPMDDTTLLTFSEQKLIYRFGGDDINTFK